MVIGIVLGTLVILGLVAGYFVWYVPYATDRDALRTYVIANNVFLRSGKVAGVEYNVLSKIPYGSELITYSKDEEWAEIKVNGTKGFVASPYLLEWDDFKLLNDVWGSADAKEYIESSKCRLALIDYCKRNHLNTGNEAWQLYTLQKDVKPNNVLFPRLVNGYDKFTEFAFILKNNATQERRFAIYSFDEETEKPIFLYEETAPEDGLIKAVKYKNNEYSVSYTGNKAVAQQVEGQAKVSNVPQKEFSSSTNVDEELPQVEYEPLLNKTSLTTEDDSGDTKVYEKVDQMPEYPNGGTTGLMSFIRENLKYPAVSREKGVQGRVIVSFVVNKNGSTSDFKVVKSVDENLDNEAIRVLKSMPVWKPGKQNGVPVRVKYTVPISFQLS